MIAVVLALAVTALGGGQVFPPHALYGYIDGGAELFLEYGFVELEVRHYGLGVAAADDQAALDVEIYRMRDAAAAVGVYLATCGREQPWPEVTARNSANPYQITVLAGTTFLVVKNRTGDPALRLEMIALANEVVAASPPVALPDFWRDLPAEGRVPRSEHLFRGRFALDAIYTFGDGDPLLVEQDALGAGARYQDADGGTCRRMVVTYRDEAAARAALTHLGEHLDATLTVLVRGGDLLTWREPAGRFGRAERRGVCLDIAVQLAALP